ncbi:MAG: RNA polymerase sigma factor [Polyangiaceae bacterium]|jgi:RNA polymerase sigma-70 factor (ECF subfamily)|nr:RNA polymerase sigma factor [Polyangiaceae bacterium]
MDEREVRANQAMDRYAAGEASAFPVVYDALAPRLYRYLMKLTGGDRARAEDLVQQTFLQMHDARGRFVAGSAVAPWAYAIARRLFLDTARKGKRENLLGIAQDLAAGMVDGTPTPEADLEARRMAAELNEELARLPARQREAFLLVREEGLSMAEAALVLGTTVAGVKLRASRASKALRAVLGARGREPDEEQS